MLSKAQLNLCSENNGNISCPYKFQLKAACPVDLSQPLLALYRLQVV
jgi:hypothetical protein